MAEVVWAACVSHAGGQLRVRHSDTEQQNMDRIYAGWEQLSDSLHAARPDLLVVVGTDHLQTFTVDHMPIFALGRGDTFPTWGEFGTAVLDLAGNGAAADQVHQDLIADGFDVAGCAEMRLDHAYACPLELLDPEHNIPILPLSINTFAPPLPSLGRCRQLGIALGAALRKQDHAKRIALLATGGISHAIGTPDAGRIDPKWDTAFLERMNAGDYEQLDAITQHELETGAGFGAGELRCWMAVLGASGGQSATIVAYEPVKAWLTGTALVEVGVA